MRQELGGGGRAACTSKLPCSFWYTFGSSYTTRCSGQSKLVSETCLTPRLRMLASAQHQGRGHQDAGCLGHLGRRGRAHDPWGFDAQPPSACCPALQCVRVSHGQTEVEWEGGHNHVLAVPESGVACIMADVAWGHHVDVSAQPLEEPSYEHEQVRTDHIRAARHCDALE
jgi:hypothetical protein